MKIFEFRGTTYLTADTMLDAAAYEWLTDGGQNTVAFCREILQMNDDEELAQGCISGWGLDQSGPEDRSWMQRHGVIEEDLVAAFADLRARLTFEPGLPR